MHNPHRRTIPDTAAPLAATEPHDSKAMRRAERKAERKREKFAAMSSRPPDEIAAAFGVNVEKSDLAAVPHGLLSRALAYLAAYASGQGHLAARTGAEIESWELQNVRRQSATFAKLQDDVRRGVEEDRKMLIEDVCYLAATGNIRARDGYYPPSERAMGILLPAFDARYRPTAQPQAQAVQINVTI